MSPASIKSGKGSGVVENLRSLFCRGDRQTVTHHTGIDILKDLKRQLEAREVRQVPAVRKGQWKTGVATL